MQRASPIPCPAAKEGKTAATISAIGLAQLDTRDSDPRTKSHPSPAIDPGDRGFDWYMSFGLS